MIAEIIQALETRAQMKRDTEFIAWRREQEDRDLRRREVEALERAASQTSANRSTQHRGHPNV